jgi:pSer/pThr/pTyr-binding forkhead associated (FHA) protein
MAGLEVWGSRGQTFFELDTGPVIVGRNADCQLVLAEDDSVSRRHAALEKLGGVWQIHDLGSRNGTWINGAKLMGEQALRHADTVNVGRVRLVFRDNVGVGEGSSTSPLADPPKLTPAQHRTLVELVRPVMHPDKPIPAPASAKEIAERLYVSESATKQNLAALYDKFGIDDSGVHDRRLRLANEAIHRGAVRLRDLEETQG